MTESNLSHCKVCAQLKHRIEDGKYPNSQNKRYKDEQGKLWSGRVCPQCQVLKTKENQRKLRFKRQLEKTENSKNETSE